MSWFMFVKFTDILGFLRCKIILTLISYRDGCLLKYVTLSISISNNYNLATWPY